VLVRGGVISFGDSDRRESDDPRRFSFLQVMLVRAQCEEDHANFSQPDVVVSLPSLLRRLVRGVDGHGRCQSGGNRGRMDL
jgi:hypothetical protein